MRETFYFGKPGEKIPNERKKQWLESKGKTLKVKGKSYLIDEIKIKDNIVEVTGVKVMKND